MNTYLDFEKPIADLEVKIQALRDVASSPDLDIAKEIAALEQKQAALTQKLFANLTDWQMVQMSRHPRRPYTLDYIPLLFDGFNELHGDRTYGDDPSMVAGLARLQGRRLAVVGHQKGRGTEDKIYRNFGMASPEGYRKAERVFRLAEKFRMPVVTLIDTMGAYPGIGAEERGQSEAIARNLQVMSQLRVPIVSVVIGEGGSGGALGIGLADVLLMMAYSTYSVISPEGCASILWKDPNKAQWAAQAMGMTAPRLKALGLVDGVVAEPLGGAHRDIKAAASMLQDSLVEALDRLSAQPIDTLLLDRYQKWMRYGT